MWLNYLTCVLHCNPFCWSPSGHTHQLTVHMDVHERCMKWCHGWHNVPFCNPKCSFMQPFFGSVKVKFYLLGFCFKGRVSYAPTILYSHFMLKGSKNIANSSKFTPFREKMLLLPGIWLSRRNWRGSQNWAEPRTK